MSNVFVRQATDSDLQDIKRIAGANRHELGFLPIPKLQEAVDRQNLLVAGNETQLTGFVIYRHRKKDRQTTLYDICVDREWRNQGLGRKLVEALRSECQNQHRKFIQLKCPVDLVANSFYQHLGFRHIGIEHGKVRQLNIWRLQLLEECV